MSKFFNIDKDSFFNKGFLYKYLPLDFALKSLETKSLWLTNPQFWTDPYEKKFLTQQYNIDGKAKPFPWLYKVFCTCMTTKATNEASWKIYSAKDIMVKFAYRRDILLPVIEDAADKQGLKLFAGEVDYIKTSFMEKRLGLIPFSDPKPDFNNSKEDFLRLLLIKRAYFAYEDEFRWIFISSTPKSKNLAGLDLNLECEPTDIIDSVTIDPNVGDYLFDKLKQIFIDHYGFSPILNSTGSVRRHRVQKSNLYTKKPFNKIVDI